MMVSKPLMTSTSFRTVPVCGDAIGCRPCCVLLADTAVRDVDADVGCCRLVGQDQEGTKILRTFSDGAGQLVRGCLSVQRVLVRDVGLPVN